MASDLLSIGASGARAARGALDVTAQNIANASSDGYVRRSARLEEVASAGGIMRQGDLSLSGARIAGIHRNADMFRQSEVRRTSADLARASTELAGLQNVETAIEQAGIYDAVVAFEGSLQQLAADAADPSLRAAVISSADAMARKFNIAAESLGVAKEGMQFNAGAAVDEANVIGGELARVNLRLARAGAGSSDRASLLDQRDLLLERLSGIADTSTSFGPDGAVSVRLGGAGGALFVSGGNSARLGMATAADGTIVFDVNGAAVALAGGSLAGNALGLSGAAEMSRRLDTLADDLARVVNDAQASGADFTGAPGRAMFSGAGAAGISLAFTDGAYVAAADLGSPPASRDSGNLSAMRQALSGSNMAGQLNMLIFDISAQVAGREITHEALDTIAASARISLQQQAGVDLDTEAANLIRFQQAFQASSRAMQAATEIFDTLLGIG